MQDSEQEIILSNERKGIIVEVINSCQKFLHTTLKIVFVILLVCHTIIATFLIKYRWKTSITRIFKRKASTTSLLKVTQRITGLLVLCSAVLVIVSGLDYYFNWREPFVLLQHVQFDILLYISFTVHITAGLKVALNRRRISAGKSNFMAAALFIGLILFVASFESGFIYTKTKEPGNRILIDGNYYDVDTSLPVQSRPDIFQENHYSVFDALVSVCQANNLELVYHFDETMDTHVIDSLNGNHNRWYEVYYDGGFTSMPMGEKNMFRMD